MIFHIVRKGGRKDGYSSNTVRKKLRCYCNFSICENLYAQESSKMCKRLGTNFSYKKFQYKFVQSLRCERYNGIK